MDREAQRLIRQCKLAGKKVEKPPVLEQLVATQLSEELMETFKINHKKRKRLRDFQCELTRKTKLREFKTRLVPLYPEVPRFNDSHKIIRSYAEICPSTEMSRFQELAIRRTVAARGLETKYAYIVDTIISEAREDFIRITHAAGRSICLDRYKLDPVRYFTPPGLSWDAMLKLTEIELELLTDIDMMHFFKKGIRGGISQCSERKHIANNIFVPNYDPKEPSSFIMYLDATNLYGHSMSQALPRGGFEWLSREKNNNLNVMSVSDESPQCYLFEVVVHYPQELHDLHLDLARFERS